MEQLKEAQHRVKVAGLDHKVTLLFCDYRDMQVTSSRANLTQRIRSSVPMSDPGFTVSWW